MDFWSNPTIEELMKAQGIDGPPDLDALRDTSLTDEEFAAFMVAIEAQ